MLNHHQDETTASKQEDHGEYKLAGTSLLQQHGTAVQSCLSCPYKTESSTDTCLWSCGVDQRVSAKQVTRQSRWRQYPDHQQNSLTPLGMPAQKSTQRLPGAKQEGFNHVGSWMLVAGVEIQLCYCCVIALYLQREKQTQQENQKTL
jgi:hypothetical protein